MRTDIVVEPFIESGENFTAFKISFTADDGEMAQNVTSRLTSLFIQEHLKTRENQAAATTNFLTEQLEAEKQKLKEQDGKLQAFKTQYLDELPERQSINFEMLAELRSQLQTTIASLSRSQQQRMSLETSLGERLARLQAEKSRLLARFTPRHPHVVKKH